MEIKGIWCILAASVLWGTTGTAQAYAPPGAHPAVVGAIRLLIGGAAMVLFAFWQGSFRGARSWPKLPTAFAASGVAIYQLCFFAGVARTGVAVGTIVTMGSAPVFAGLLGWWLRRERPGRQWLLATLLAITGCGLLLSAGREMQIKPGGVGFALGAGVGYALYSVCSKGLLTGRSATAVTAVICALAAIFLLPVLLLGETRWLLQPRGALIAVHLGIVATAAPYFLFARGLLIIPVATAVTLTLAEPLTAGMLGMLLLGERLTLPAALGMALIGGGLVALSAKLAPQPNVAVSLRQS